MLYSTIFVGPVALGGGRGFTSHNPRCLVPFEFIYGVSAEGLSPFEMALAEKGEGDELAIHLSREEALPYFEHLAPPLNLRVQGADLSVKLQVIKVAPASQREIIKAMAEAASCGNQCCGH